MDETEFNALAEAELGLIEAAFEAADLDIDQQPGGVLQVEFDDGSQMIINRHSAAREIWVAARQGGFHFHLKEAGWIAARDGSELWQRLETLASAQAGRAVRLERSA